MKPKIIVALDDLDFSNAFTIAKLTAGKVWGVKINDLLVRYGADIIRQFTHAGVRVMADPKLFDIPNTMINSLKPLDENGADIVTIHLSAGAEALKAARKSTNVDLFGITVLTSMPDKEVENIYFAQRGIVVSQLMLVAKEAGLTGVVCSADQVSLATRLGLKTIVPGIRLPDMEVAGDDQVHKATTIPDADYIVVGRPIVRAPDPAKAVERIAALIDARGEPCAA